MRTLWFNQLDFGNLCRATQLELTKAFGRLGHSLRIVAPYRHTKPQLPPSKPRPLLLKQHLPHPAGGIFFQLQLFFLAACEIAKKVDLILLDHFCVPTMLPFNLLSKAGLIRTKFVLYILSAPVDMVGVRYALSLRRYNLSVRWAKVFYDGIVVISDLYREDISSRFRIAPAKIGVCTSGVRANVFDPRRVDKGRADSIKYRLGLRDRLALVYHGVLSPYRGLQEVVKALALLKSQGRREAVWVVLGDGPAAGEIASLAEEHGVTDAVKLVGSVPYKEVPDYLSVCDVGILPYPDIKWLDMNSPLKLLEYLAMEKPVILTDIAAHRAVMGDATCAFYISDNSPAGIARAIRKLAKEKSALAQLGKQGREIILEEFTWERQAENILSYTAKLRFRSFSKRTCADRALVHRGGGGPSAELGQPGRPLLLKKEANGPAASVSSFEKRSKKGR